MTIASTNGQEGAPSRHSLVSNPILTKTAWASRKGAGVHARRFMSSCTLSLKRSISRHSSSKDKLSLWPPQNQTSITIKNCPVSSPKPARSFRRTIVWVKTKSQSCCCWWATSSHPWTLKATDTRKTLTFWTEFASRSQNQPRVTLWRRNNLETSFLAYTGMQNWHMSFRYCWRIGYRSEVGKVCHRGAARNPPAKFKTNQRSTSAASTSLLSSRTETKNKSTAGSTLTTSKNWRKINPISSWKYRKSLKSATFNPRS